MHTEVIIYQLGSSGSEQAGQGTADHKRDGRVGADGATVGMEGAEEIKSAEDHADVVCLEAEGL